MIKWPYRVIVTFSNNQVKLQSSYGSHAKIRGELVTTCKTSTQANSVRNKGNYSE